MHTNFNQVRKAALIATVAACAMAVPAQARDGEGYVGLDAGLVIPQDTRIDVSTFNNAIVVDSKKGYDVDLKAGYDWGLLRTELELDRKQWKADSFVAGGVGIPDPAGPALFGQDAKVDAGVPSVVFSQHGVIMRETAGTFFTLAVLSRSCGPPRVVCDLPSGLAVRGSRQPTRGRRLDEGRLDEQEL